MIVARQSTARTMMVGPVLDADGVAVTTAVVGNFKISKNGGAPAALDASATLTHRNTGQYSLALTANDLDTVGQAEVVIDATVNASPIKEISVLEEAVYDSIFAAGATGYQVPIWSSAGATVNLSATTISAVSGAVGSVTGAVGSVTGAVGSVTGNVGGNVVGSVASVTGNVGGNVTGSVGSVATGGITAASIATGAIDADALATDAISEIADGVWDEPLAAHTTADTPGNVLNMLTQDTVTLSTDVSLNSIIGQLLDAGTTWTYDRTTDSLEANRDNTGTAGAGLTAIDLPDQTMNITGNITGNLSGSVGSVTGAVGSVTAGVTVTTNNDKTGYSLTATTGLGNQTANITGNLSGSVGSVTGAVGSVTGAVGSVTGNIGGNVVGSVASVTGDIGGLAAGAITDVEDAVWDAVLANHLDAGSTGFALNAAGSAGDPWGTALPGAYGAGTAGNIIGNLNDITAADVWAAATRTLTSGANIGTVQAQLIDGAHGGAATVFTFERMIGLATTSNANCVTLTGNGTGDGLHLQGGALGDGVHSQGGASSGHGGNFASTSGSGIVLDGSLYGMVFSGGGTDILLANSSAPTLQAAILTAGSIDATVAPNLDAAVSSRMATYTQPTGFLAATFPATVASTTNITAGTITTVSGNVNGSVGSVTGAVGSVTGTVTANVTQWNGSAVAIPTVAGVPEVDVTHWIGTVPSSPDTPGIPMVQVLVPGGLVVMGNDYNTGTLSMNITGDLSGSVGSVTGAVGSVTGSVGSVAADGITSTSLAASAGTEIGTAVWASATRTLTAGTNIGTVQAQLADGVAHGGATATVQFATEQIAQSVVTNLEGSFDMAISAQPQADIRGAVGLASANLDTQLAALPTASENASAVWAFVCEGAITAVEILRGILSFIGGQTLGGNTTNPRFRDQANTKNRIDMTVDSAGNRTATTLDLN